MSVKVRTQFMSSFNIPHQCVACGGPPGSKTKKVSGSASSGRKKYITLTLDFPLCEECAAVRGSRWYAVLFAVAGVLVSLFLGVVAGNLASQRLTTGLTVLAAIVVIAVSIYLTTWLANRIAQSGMTAEQRKRRKALRRSVRMSVSTPGIFGKGAIRFAFENPAFATEFAALNGGTVG